jgi:Fe2+ transport system protein FeoA
MRPRPLSRCAEDERVAVIANPDRQSVEIGLHRGAHVQILKNGLADPNIVVAVDDARYVLSRATANHIRVRPIRQAEA